MRPDEAPTEVARWAHLWFVAALHTQDTIQSYWDDEHPATSIGTRDALALVFVDAIRNVYRGAVFALGPEHSAIAAWDVANPGLKELRDRLEHFDQYVRGRGNYQNSLDRGAGIGLDLGVSTGDAAGGHTLDVVVREKGQEIRYTVETVATSQATRQLVLEMLQHVELDDERHRLNCRVCRPF